MLRATILSSAALLAPGASSAQWWPYWALNHAYGSTLLHTVTDMETDTDGNTYVLGCMHDTITYEVIVYKTSWYGALLWTYVAPGNADFGDLDLDLNGNVCVTFRGSGNIKILKLDPDGSLLWSVDYDGPHLNSIDIAYGLAAGPLGQVSVAGWSPNGSGDFDPIVLLYDSSGNFLWERRYDDPSGSEGQMNDVIFNAAGDIVATGQVSDSITTALMVCYDASGNLQWSDTLAWGMYSAGCEIRLSTGGDLFVGGRAASDPAGPDYLCMKYNDTGLRLWADTAGWDSLWERSDWMQDMAVDEQGNVWLTGTKAAGNGQYDDYFTVKWNTNGVLQWSRTYDGPEYGYDDAHSIALDPYGNCYVVGNSSAQSLAYQPLLLLKYDSLGNETGQALYYVAFNDAYRWSRVGLDQSANYVFIGTSRGIFPGTMGFVNLRYNNTVGVPEMDEVRFLRIAPNPADGSIWLDLNGFIGEVRVSLFDALGHLVRVQGASAAVEHLDTSELSPGCYRIVASDPFGRRGTGTVMIQ